MLRLSVRMERPGILMPYEVICPGIVFGANLQHPMSRSIMGRLFVAQVRLRKAQRELQSKMQSITFSNAKAQPILQHQFYTRVTRCQWDDRRRLQFRNYCALNVELGDEIEIIQHTCYTHITELQNYIISEMLAR